MRTIVNRCRRRVAGAIAGGIHTRVADKIVCHEPVREGRLLVGGKTDLRKGLIGSTAVLIAGPRHVEGCVLHYQVQDLRWVAGAVVQPPNLSHPQHGSVLLDGLKLGV